MTGFTDGCPGLRSILAAAGITKPPILDWFHIAMRLQHLKQIADGLAADDAARVEARAIAFQNMPSNRERYSLSHPARWNFPCMESFEPSFCMTLSAMWRRLDRHGYGRAG
ncbi:hypothetical protein [Acidiphilium sp. PM]|uniref:hypothetical protein n=1 Tax=Acidiphilium sp. PM TaxID=1043206 RepID=UPI0002144F65|nr:hypothetical protein [Acidiphilium sp. PM]EGO93303.1 Hypothetical protein APM_0034 [Acidiphilium sp. PM]